MSKKLEQGVWIVMCDWKDPETDKSCDLGHDSEPSMFIDPDGGRNPEMHFQCGSHHDIIKQSDKEEYQLPEGHKLGESTITPQGSHRAKDVGVTLEGFGPDVSGRVWEGEAVDLKENSNDRGK